MFSLECPGGAAHPCPRSVSDAWPGLGRYRPVDSLRSRSIDVGSSPVRARLISHWRLSIMRFGVFYESLCTAIARRKFHVLM